MSKETGSSEFSFCSTTDSSHSLEASHFLLPLPFSVWKMGVILTSFIVWRVRHVPRHILGKWFSPWLKKSLREVQVRVIRNRGRVVSGAEWGFAQSSSPAAGGIPRAEGGWETVLLMVFITTHTGSRSVTEGCNTISLPPAYAPLLLCCFHHPYLTPPCESCSVWSLPAHPGSFMLHLNVTWGGHVPAALVAQLCTHCCWWRSAASRSSGSCPASLADGFPSFQHTAKAQAHSWTQALGSPSRCWCRWHEVTHRAKKEQLSTSCTLWGHHCPPHGWLHLSILGTGLKGLLKPRGCLIIAIPPAQEEWQSESQPVPQLLSTMREGTVQSALSALWRCPPFSIPCQAPHLCCFFSCASTASLYCG